MERPKKSCSCFGMFSKKIPKKVDQGTETRQMIRSSLINFSSSVFQSEENQNNSLSSTQKIQSNLPFSNTLTSPLCRTPSIYQFSNSHVRENSANPGSSHKARAEEEADCRRKSISYNPLEEVKEKPFARSQEDKKNEVLDKAKLMSTESSVVMKNEKMNEGNFQFSEVHDKLYGIRGNLEDKKEAQKGINEVFEKGSELNSVQNANWDQRVESLSRPEIDEGLRVGSLAISDNSSKELISNHQNLPKTNLKEDHLQGRIENIEEVKTNKENQQKIPDETAKIDSNLNKNQLIQVKIPENPVSEIKENSNLSEIPPKEIQPSLNNSTPITICEIIEELDLRPEKNDESPKVLPSSELPKPFISKEEPVLNMKTENFQVDTVLKTPEEPIFLKIIQKSNENDDIPEPDNSSPVKPFLNQDLLKIPASNSPKLSSNFPKLSENLFESNIFIKEAAKKSFENLVNRISSDKKQLKPPNRLKVPETESSQGLNPEVPRKVDLKFKNSQEILRELIIKPSGPALAFGQKLKPESSVLDSVVETIEENKLKVKPEQDKHEKSGLSHSKSFSVNNTIIIHESREYSKRFSMIGKDFESSYSGKRFKFALDSNDYPSPTNLVISPRNGIRRLPSLKISPIKSILSADDYSDILSFLKNSPHASAMSNKKEPDQNPMKKYKLPALKPITPHYFHKKRSAPQLKQKARIMIEHL